MQQMEEGRHMHGADRMEGMHAANGTEQRHAWEGMHAADDEGQRHAWGKWGKERHE